MNTPSLFVVEFEQSEGSTRAHSTRHQLQSIINVDTSTALVNIALADSLKTLTDFAIVIPHRLFRPSSALVQVRLDVYIFICILRAMKFSWRESKRATNLKKHGFDFVDAEQVFNGPTFTIEDEGDYNGEQRFNTTGFLDSDIVTICHTETADEIHMIFMRKAESHEIDILSRCL